MLPTTRRRARADRTLMGLLVAATCLWWITPPPHRDPWPADHPPPKARPIDLQSAPPSSLELLPGIGRKRARAFVAHRQREGFESWEDVLAIPGIGPRTLARWRAGGLVQLGPSPRAAPYDAPHER